VGLQPHENVSKYEGALAPGFYLFAPPEALLQQEPEGKPASQLNLLTR